MPIARTHAGYEYERLNTADAEETVSTSQMFRLPARERTRVCAQAQGAVAPMHTALDVRGDDAEIDGHAKLMERAFDAGVRAQKARNANFENSRFWRCACASSTIAFVTLCAVVVYWVVAMSTSMSQSLDLLNAQRPQLLLKTVDDASALLSGAARTSTAFGEMSEAARPSLVNMTSASASMLSRLAALLGKPTITLAMGGTG